jgi:hypothetical protein
MDLLKSCDGRQSSLFAIVPWNYADINGTTFTPAFELPADAVVLGGFLRINSVTNAANIEVGDSVDPDSLLAATSGAALARTNFTTGAKVAAPQLSARTVFGLKASAPLTQGSGIVVCEYIRTGRAQVTQG